MVSFKPAIQKLQLDDAPFFTIERGKVIPYKHAQPLVLRSSTDQKQLAVWWFHAARHVAWR